MFWVTLGGDSFDKINDSGHFSIQMSGFKCTIKDELRNKIDTPFDETGGAPTYQNADYSLPAMLSFGSLSEESRFMSSSLGTLL